jgi:hypothetical protein
VQTPEAQRDSGDQRRQAVQSAENTDTGGQDHVGEHQSVDDPKSETDQDVDQDQPPVRAARRTALEIRVVLEEKRKGFAERNLTICSCQNQSPIVVDLNG